MAIRPAITVAIPARNYARYVGAAIESVLIQGVSDIEIIVVDDGSEDGTAEAASSYEGVVVLRQDHQGVGAARNAGVDRAAGDLIAFLDADDVWAPGKLIAQLEELSTNAGEVVFGYVEEFLSEDLTDAERAGVRARPGRHAALLPSTVLTSRETLARIGPFRTDRDSGEALDWALRVAEAGIGRALAEEATTYRRIHASNSGRVMRSAQQSEYVAAIKRSLDRRRSGQDGAT